MSLKKLGLVALLALTVAGCGSEYMRKMDSRPEIKADPAKATLIIYRETSYGWMKEIHNYLDKNYIGTTKGKCYFVAKVDPGTHYVIADAENKACAKVNLEANKVYFLKQAIFPGIMSARTGFFGVEQKDFDKQQGEMDYIIINTEEKSPTLDEKDYNETVADFDKEDKKDPKKHEDTDNLKGF